MNSLKPSSIKLALLTAVFAFSLPLVAHYNVKDEIETIEVTGIRASLIKAQTIKQDQSSVVEVITAEDIGKLPDVSIAESLARLPGLAGQRINGHAQIISIRGLSPDFSTN